MAAGWGWGKDEDNRKLPDPLVFFPQSQIYSAPLPEKSQTPSFVFNSSSPKIVYFDHHSPGRTKLSQTFTLAFPQEELRKNCRRFWELYLTFLIKC